MALLLSTVPSCGDQQREVLSEEEFTEIYGDILYLGELYRAHPFELRLALDSMLEYRNIDTVMVYEAVIRYARRTYDVAQLHADLIERLETAARQDSARNAPPAKEDTVNTSADTGSSSAAVSGNR